MDEKYIPLDRQGYTSTVYRLPDDPPRVCKSFDKGRTKDGIDKLFATEKAAYERFTANNPPSSLLKYYGVHETIPNGLILEFAEHRDLYAYIWESSEKRWQPTDEQLYRWASQAAKALEFSHSVGVYNSDIHSINFFLDGVLNLKVGDWAGASIDGSVSHSSYRLRYRQCDKDGGDVPRRTGITASTEIFALGMVLYNMVVGEEPWPELREPEDAAEIKKRIGDKDFPDTAKLPVLGMVSSKCWLVEFGSMTEVRCAIEAERAFSSQIENASS
ncbi:unnamed protein product [Zymoseptoria tritici ST99CH_3D1]|nr:unnamed protein product [Zymoseptoria tritici ST99CH_3D1]